MIAREGTQHGMMAHMAYPRYVMFYVRECTPVTHIMAHMTQRDVIAHTQRDPLSPSEPCAVCVTAGVPWALCVIARVPLRALLCHSGHMASPI